MIGLMEQRHVFRPATLVLRVPIHCKGDAAVFTALSKVSPEGASDEAAAPIVWLNCVHCGRKIVRANDRIEVNAKHEHTFINPAGVIYKIGCFSSAPGAAEFGPSSAEFAWFRGHVWRCLCCSDCETHIGWTFTADATHFCGLIFDQLSEGAATF